MSAMVSSGEGVQVLSVVEEGYQCEEGALRRVLRAGGGAARALPVVVVSVAGATRGGKSFLLDYFLRYLLAPEAARRSGAWLGKDDESLTGFSWRGGCERHTEGILAWSVPIIVTLGPERKNEKVAVVLLDTQGSFDSSSTMRDSSTIFALSTLLSSVQIYNLSQNIKEDDLHYLQLFTEYGRLAREEGAETPFQELWFLVRDWCFAYDHPYGADGGQQLLDKRLEIRPEQASELREVRSQVRSAFERVRGFLMPHPGLTVAASPAFTGCLKDISGEFKDALLELVPAIFAPENMKIKHINGQPMTLQDFEHYFKTYVEIFNSDTLPTPVTLMQATSEASLETALRACREKYASHMERCACVPRGTLPARHAAALDAARRTFAARRTLAAPQVAAARLEALLQELEGSLADYEAINSGRILDAARRCKVSYEAAMQTEVCLAPNELTKIHTSAVALAKKCFYAQFAKDEHTREWYIMRDDESESSINDSDEHDSVDSGDEIVSNEYDTAEEEEDSEPFEDDNEDWNILERELTEVLPLYRERNALRITAARESAQEWYCTRMGEVFTSAPCLHPRSLRTHHHTIVEEATDQFLSAWHDKDTVPQKHKEELRTYIEEKYFEFNAKNNENNEIVMEEAIDIYRNIMIQICDGPQFLHPAELTMEHERAEQAATQFFLNRRDAASRGLPNDNFLIEVHRKLRPIYRSLEQSNERRNQEAVKDAHEYYLRRINPAGGGNGVWDLLNPAREVFQRHPSVKQAAIERFKTKRRTLQQVRVQDTHLNDLDKKIEESFSWLSFKVVASTVATGAAALALIFL